MTTPAPSSAPTIEKSRAEKLIELRGKLVVEYSNITKAAKFTEGVKESVDFVDIKTSGVKICTSSPDPIIFSAVEAYLKDSCDEYQKNIREIQTLKLNLAGEINNLKSLIPPTNAVFNTNIGNAITEISKPCTSPVDFAKTLEQCTNDFNSLSLTDPNDIKLKDSLIGALSKCGGGDKLEKMKDVKLPTNEIDFVNMLRMNASSSNDDNRKNAIDCIETIRQQKSISDSKLDEVKTAIDYTRHVEYQAILKGVDEKTIEKESGKNKMITDIESLVVTLVSSKESELNKIYPKLSSISTDLFVKSQVSALPESVLRNILLRLNKIK